MHNATLLGLALLLPFTSWAADEIKPLNVKPGLWETTVTSQMAGLPPIPQELLSKLSPEQRARMEAAAKEREAKGPQSTTHKACVTQEELSKPLTFGNTREACQTTVTNSSSSKQDIHIECSQAGLKTVGNIHLEAVNSENVKGTTEMNSSAGVGNLTMKSSFTAKWLGADCGDLKK